MTKATIKITGDRLKELLTQSMTDLQNDKYAVHYELETASVFMFDQYNKSRTNFAFNIIIDYSKMSPGGDEIMVQCFALGAKNKHEIRLINYEKSTIQDFHAHLFAFSKRHKCNWKIEEPTFL